MAFNELNSVEHFIIHRLTGTNLNTAVAEEPTNGYGTEWIYKAPSELKRSTKEILVESDLKDALIRLNPAIE